MHFLLRGPCHKTRALVSKMAHPGKKDLQQCSLEDRDFKADSRFINLKPIGIGGNGIVYSAVDSECEKEVAIKKICFSDKRSCKYAFRELRIMRRLHHENIVAVYEVLGPGVCSATDNMMGSLCELNSVYIVQELLDTDLQQLLFDEGRPLGDEHIRFLLYQLLRGLKYIHSANVLHRDLKPSNLLINLDDLVLKIGDFGLARVVDSDYTHKGFLTDQVGTCWYRSPELIISPNDYTKAIDIWSAGCILMEMLIGRPLFPGSHEMEQISLLLHTLSISDNDWNSVTQVLPKSVMKRIPRNPEKLLKDRFPNIDLIVMNLVEKMLTFNSKQRITAEEALQHSYLKAYCCPADEPVASQPFYIEHEVDDLSPKMLRRYINRELQDEARSCGTSVQPFPRKVTIDCSSPTTTSTNSLSYQQRISNLNAHTDHYSISSILPAADEACKNEKNKELTNLSNLWLPSQMATNTRNYYSRQFTFHDQISHGHEMTDTSNNKSAKSKHYYKGSDTIHEMKVKDRVNLERKGERVPLPRHRNVSHHSARLLKEQQLLTVNEADSLKFVAEKQQCEKKLARQNKSDRGCGTDFDRRYRLPTEHLTRQHKHSHGLDGRPFKLSWDNSCILPSEMEKLSIWDDNMNSEATDNYGASSKHQSDLKNLQDTVHWSEQHQDPDYSSESDDL